VAAAALATRSDVGQPDAPTEIRKVGPTPTIVLSGVNNTLNLAEKANLSQRRRNALFQPTLIQ